MDHSLQEDNDKSDLNNYENQEEEDDREFDEEEEEEEEEEIRTGFTSIWDMVTPANSPLEGMLSEDNVANTTLFSVLDEDTLLQELKSPNTKVVEYLSKNENITEMLLYLTTRQYQEDLDEVELKNAAIKDTESEKKYFKFPYIVSEIIACNNEEINETIVETPEHLSLFFSFLLAPNEQEEENRKKKTLVNASLPSYFSRALSTLLQTHYVKITDEIMKMNKADDNIVEKMFIDNINLVDLNTVVLKLLGIETSELDSFNEQDFFSGLGQPKIREFYLNKRKGNSSKIQEYKEKMKVFVVENKFFDMLLNSLKRSAIIDDDKNELFQENIIKNTFSIFRAIVESTKVNNNQQNFFGMGFAPMQMFGGFGQQTHSPNSPSMKANKNMMNALCTEANLTRLLDVILNKDCHETLFVLGLDFLKTVSETFSEYEDPPNRDKRNDSNMGDMDGSRVEENESDESGGSSEEYEDEDDEEVIRKKPEGEEIETKKKSKKKNNYLEKKKTEKEEPLHPCVAVILAKTKDFVKILLEKEEDEKVLSENCDDMTRKEILHSYMSSVAPLGEKKLRIVSHFLLLFKIKSHGVIRKTLRELGIVRILVDIFFDYPFNNILHTVLLEIFQFILRPQQRDILSEKELESVKT